MTKTQKARWQERREFSRRERRLFRSVMEIQAPSGKTEPMQQFVLEKAKEFGATAWIDNGNVYAVKGQADIYPCMVAHSDQVHDAIPQERYTILRSRKGEWWAYDNEAVYDKDEDKWTCPQVGIGGDDKVGVYIALNMLRTREVMKVAIFRDEEVGCRGAALALMDFFENVAFVLECDRRGNDDFVDSIGGTIISESFRKAVRPILDKRGYGFSWGATTDVDELADNGIEVSVANMSCGYYAPHSDMEFCVEEDVLSAQLLCTEIIETMGDVQWTHTHNRRGYYQAFGTRGYWDDDNYGTWTNLVTPKNRMSSTATSLKARGFTYSSTYCTWMPPKEALRRTQCSCLDSARELVWETDRKVFTCADCKRDYLTKTGTGSGKCTCGGDLGYTWNKERSDWLCNDCGFARPFGADLTPWHTIPTECPHCFCGNARLTWESIKLHWWCMECLGNTDGGFIGENTDRHVQGKARIDRHLDITHTLLLLKQHEREIDLSDPLVRNKIEKDLISGELDDTIMREEKFREWYAWTVVEAQRGFIPLNAEDKPAIALPASLDDEIEDGVWTTMPTHSPDTCNGCNADATENLFWAGDIGMWKCVGCNALTPPLYAD